MSDNFRRYIKKQHYPNAPQNIKFKTNFKNCVYKALLRREWKETYADDWNLMWCEKEQIDWVFEKHRMFANMKVNHFRGWTELCRKDMLNKNLKKHKRALEKQNQREQSNEYDFLPATFLLPSEYVILHEEFKRVQTEGRCLWIMKPTSKCQGRGIFIFSKVSEIARWKSFNRDDPPEPYVCQKYLMNPMLLGGRKFDMRLYALCTSFNPLTIYLYRAGFARFAHDRYDNNDTGNLYKHLTNVAININAPNYVKRIGGKWFLEELKKYMLSKFGIEKANNAFFDIQRSVIKSMKAVQKLVTSCPQSFELYGFDFIFDMNCKAWLLQVNGGPSMTANTKQDEELKLGLVDDTMTVINLQGILIGDEELVGGFDLVYKNQHVGSSTASIYTSMLGCKNSRQDNLKKLARTTAFRLAKEYLEKIKGNNSREQLSSKKITNKFNIKPNCKADRSRQPRVAVNPKASNFSLSTEEPKQRKLDTKKSLSTYSQKNELQRETSTTSKMKNRQTECNGSAKHE